MPYEKREKRKDRRFFFTRKQSISTTLQKTGNSTKQIPATLMSLSGGGISLFLDRKYLTDISQGDEFILKPDQDTEPSTLLKGAEVQIMHIQNYHIYINICCGCKFTNINEDNRNKIHDWIQHRFREDFRHNH